MTNRHPTVSIDNITKRFGDFTAVNQLSLAVYPGRIYGLLGPNGAGKTTTIRMIVNIMVPDSGRIKVFGQELTPSLQDRIGYLPEERGLYKNCLLYTSDAADERSSVDLGGRRIIKKKKKKKYNHR